MGRRLAETLQRLSKKIDDCLGSMDEIERLEKSYRNEVATLQQELATARSANEVLQNKLIAIAADEKAEFSSSERKSLLTFVIAAAVDGYGYESSDIPSTTPATIVSTADRAGLLG